MMRRRFFLQREHSAFIVGRNKAACQRLCDALGKDSISPPALPAFSPPASNFSRVQYEAAVERVIERIRNGDFYQANIAQLLTVKCDEGFSPFELMRIIADESDAQFGALLQFGAGSVISNSPERFFKLDPSGRLVVEPIKGTRKRAENDREDAALAEELLSDPKDRAENIMIADLMRNDLSKICRDGSIDEEAICELMTLTKVHHLVSRISGVLREELGVIDVFRALFPSGSITGAPKIAAMNEITEIERIGRGPYCGAIGYIDDSGAADFSVAIRTLMTDASEKKITIPVGGGITLRSTPAAEYEETLVKAKSALDALSQNTSCLR